MQPQDMCFPVFIESNVVHFNVYISYITHISFIYCIETQSQDTLINGSLVTLNNATLNNGTLIMFTYLTLLISHVYTVFYTIYCTLPMPLGHRSSISIYLLNILTHSHSPLLICVYYVVVGELLDYLLDLCVLGRVWELLDYLLDITAQLELQAQAFRYTRINIC